MATSPEQHTGEACENVPQNLLDAEKELAGTWTLEKNENLDEYLKKIGLNFVFRKIATAASCTLEISRVNKQMRIITKGPKTSDHTFELDKEVDSEDPVDNKMKAIVTWEDGKLVTRSKPAEKSKALPTTVVREVDKSGHKLIMTVSCDNLVMQRIFVKKD